MWERAPNQEKVSWAMPYMTDKMSKQPMVRSRERSIWLRARSANYRAPGALLAGCLGADERPHDNWRDRVSHARVKENGDSHA